MFYFHLLFKWLLLTLITNVTILSQDLIGKNTVKSDKSDCNGAFPAINCIWSNGSHQIDLTSLSYQVGGHFAFGKNDDSKLFFVNLCRPLKQKKDKIRNHCPSTAGICMHSLNFSTLTISLGQPLVPLFADKDGNLIAQYSEGDICSSNKNIRYNSIIKFRCDSTSEENIPHFVEVINDCTYFFEWPTSLVCEPDPISVEGCIFKDTITEKTADLTPILNKYGGSKFHEFDKNEEKIFLNVCSNQSLPIEACHDSALCYLSKNKENESYVSFGALNTKSIKFNGKHLILSYNNGSLCNSNSQSSLWSSELRISCSNSTANSVPLIKSTTDCKALIEMNHEAICSLIAPHCTLRDEDFLFDLRELSSITHSWFTNDSSTNQTYFFNICRHQTKDKLNKQSAAVRCWNEKGKEVCDTIGQVDTILLFHIKSSNNSSDKLILTYKNGSYLHCNNNLVKASTRITFICDSKHHKPKFIGKVENTSVCEFNFEWKTYFACPAQIDYKEEKFELKDGFIFDKNNSYLIYLKPIFNKTFETISQNDDGTIYKYIFSLNESLGHTSNCLNAAVCQTKTDGQFSRDIGSTQTQEIYKKGTEFKMILTSKNHQKCGKNKDKNVTTLVTFICDPKMEIGSPVFEYESNNCDYIFFWKTNLVCPINFKYLYGLNSTTNQSSSVKLSSTTTTPLVSVIANLSTLSTINTELVSSSVNLSIPLVPMESKNKSANLSFFRLIMIMIVVVATILLAMIFMINEEKRKSIFSRIRGLFRSPVPTSLHYSQVPDSTKLVPLENTDEF